MGTLSVSYGWRSLRASLWQIKHMLTPTFSDFRAWWNKIAPIGSCWRKSPNFELMARWAWEAGYENSEYRRTSVRAATRKDLE